MIDKSVNTRKAKKELEDWPKRSIRFAKRVTDVSLAGPAKKQEGDVA